MVLTVTEGGLMRDGASVLIRKKVPEVVAAPSMVPLSLPGSCLYALEVPGHCEGHFSLVEDSRTS